MADGVDAKRRIEYGKCASEACEEKTAYPTHYAVVQKADEKSAA
jgi:hypothetical protein